MDRDFKSLAIIIKKEKKGERNGLLTLLSPDLGLIKAISFGSARSPKGDRFPLYAEGLFSLSKKGENAIYVKDVEILTDHDWVKNNLDKIGWVTLFSELVILSRLCDSKIYSLYTSVLDEMENKNVDRCAVYFISHFLLIEGLSGDWKVCPMCQREYRDDEILGFSTLSGTACCSSCDTLSSSLILPPNARRYIMYVSSSAIETSLAYKISDEFVKKISHYLVRTLEVSFPARLKTIESGLLG